MHHKDNIFLNNITCIVSYQSVHMQNLDHRHKNRLPLLTHTQMCNKINTFIEYMYVVTVQHLLVGCNILWQILNETIIHNLMKIIFLRYSTGGSRTISGLFSFKMFVKNIDFSFHNLIFVFSPPLSNTRCQKPVTIPYQKNWISIISKMILKNS